MRSDCFLTLPDFALYQAGMADRGFILLIYVPHSPPQLPPLSFLFKHEQCRTKTMRKTAEDNLLLMSAGFYLHMSFTPRFFLGL